VQGSNLSLFAEIRCICALGPPVGFGSLLQYACCSGGSGPYFSQAPQPLQFFPEWGHLLCVVFRTFPGLFAVVMMAPFRAKPPWRGRASLLFDPLKGSCSDVCSLPHGR